MANSWLRLWHDMPNDPKWRTIARVSGQSISTVLSVYVHLLVDASQNVTRGHVDVTSEDLASALDVTEEAIEAILAAMESRVKVGDELSGWSKRQPKREDAGDEESGAKSATERKRQQRERDKNGSTQQGGGSGVTTSHGKSRNVTLDKDKDTDKDTKPKNPSAEFSAEFVEFWNSYPKKVGKADAYKSWKKHKPSAAAVQAALAWQVNSEQWLKDGGQFIPNPATWLNQGRWQDEKQDPVGKALSGKPWFLTEAGVNAKAEELELKRDRDELPFQFTARVRKAAGVTPEMLRAANIDFGGRV